MSEPKPAPSPSRDRRPAPSPYLLSLILFAMAIWFAYDGFLNTEFIEEHKDDAMTMGFNRYGAVILFVLAAVDFYRMRKVQLQRAAKRAAAAADPAEPGSPA